MTDVVISKETLKRIISDVSQITKHPLEDNGIYYKHDETEILKGYVLIVPKEESPYMYGNYLFTVEFPTNYPYSPPTVKYMTNNGYTRFHPNFYRNGKVCLSILNTWKGDQWTSCNTLSSVLLNIVTIFTKNPFLHEPGITETHEHFYQYSDVIEYQNYETAIYNMITNKNFRKKLAPLPTIFAKEIQACFSENKAEILRNLEQKAENKKDSYPVEVPFYKMNEWIDYPNLYQKLKEYNDSL